VEFLLQFIKLAIALNIFMTQLTKDFSDEEIIRISKELDDIPSKLVARDSKRIKFIQGLEPSIRKMIAKGYTLKEVCNRLDDNYNVKITGPTLSKYLENIELDRERSKREAIQAKQEATKVKREATRLAKAAAAIAPESSDNDKVLESTQSSEAVTSQAVELVPEAIAPITTNNSQVSGAKNLPKGKGIKSIPPNIIEVQDTGIQHKVLTKEEMADERERLEQLALEKHYNKY
jgi:septation ring formation regulator EzrA